MVQSARAAFNGEPPVILRESVKVLGASVIADKLKREAWAEKLRLIDDANLHGRLSILR